MRLLPLLSHMFHAHLEDNMIFCFLKSQQELSPIAITFQGIRQWPFNGIGHLCQHQWMLQVWAPGFVYAQLAEVVLYSSHFLCRARAS